MKRIITIATALLALALFTGTASAQDSASNLPNPEHQCHASSGGVYNDGEKRAIGGTVITHARCDKGTWKDDYRGAAFTFVWQVSIAVLGTNLGIEVMDSM